MRKIGTLLCLLCVLSNATSQGTEAKNTEIQTLFGGKSGFGGYLGFTAKAGELNGQEALYTGGELCFVLNRSFNMGFEGYGLVNKVNSPNASLVEEPLYVQMGYGGLHLEPVILSENLIHFSIPVLLGAGGVADTHHYLVSEDEHGFHVNYPDSRERSDFFFVAEPGLNVELNLFKFMRVAAGGSYRFVSNINMEQLEDKDLEGFNGHISLRVGWF